MKFGYHNLFEHNDCYHSNLRVEKSDFNNEIHENEKFRMMSGIDAEIFGARHPFIVVKVVYNEVAYIIITTN